MGGAHYSEVLGVKGVQAELQDGGGSPGLKLAKRYMRARLECVRGGWKSKCRREMRRYLEERRWRRQPPETQLTLIHESVERKQD